jgi:hypothetical protein
MENGALRRIPHELHGKKITTLFILFLDLVNVGLEDSRTLLSTNTISTVLRNFMIDLFIYLKNDNFIF